MQGPPRAQAEEDAFIAQLDREIDGWQREQIVTDEQARQIRTRYHDANRARARTWPSCSRSSARP